MKADLTIVEAYSEALFEAAKKAGALDQVEEDSRQLESLGEVHPRLRAFFVAPNIPRETKEEFFARVFGPRIHPLLGNFFRLLIRRGRLEVYRPAMADFHERVRHFKGIRSATLDTAVELDQETRDRLRSVLENYSGFQLEITHRTDPDLIGGVRFKCGDLFIDTSLESGLAALRHELLSTRVY